MSSTPPPPGSASSFDVVRCFRVLFDDAEWAKKLLFGSLFVALSFLVVGAFFLAGYVVQLIRNAARGEPTPLPEWDDLGALFQDGLAPVGAYILYAIGATLVPASVGCVVGLAAGGLSSIGSGGSPEAIAEGGVALGVVIFYLLTMVMTLLLLAFFPAALTRLALEQRFGAAFEFGEIVAYIRRNSGNYLLAVIAFVGASVASQFGMLLACIGFLPFAFWSYVVLGWGLGEAARLDPGR